VTRDSRSTPAPGSVTVRPETAADVAAVHAVTAAAFTGVAHSAPPVEPGGPPGEATLVDRLRADPGWIPELALVAVDDGAVVGHVVATRGDVAGRPALGLGPVSVRPDRQGTGIGSRLVRALLAAAADRGEGLVVLLGDPGYYHRFGFRPARELGIEAPDPGWGDFFQALALPGHDPAVTGRFTYAAPFDSL
jgi:putative acetyltransferase